MQALRNKQVVLGVTGGIAAYKSAEICRRLQDRGATVQVVMTEAATRFVAPLTFQALSGRPVRTSLLDPAAEAAMGHIELARWADLVLVAPASADFLARLAAGMADDLLTTTCCATAAPIVAAPAMNQRMWAAPATRRNIDTLAGDGVRLWGPDSGDQACGDVGAGRMIEPGDVVERVCALLAPRGALTGRHVVITAGPTREAIDPVRYVSNHSSGKQGFALAAAAAAAGARVTLVAGPVDLPTPSGVERVDVVSARDMLAAVEAVVGNADVFVAVAAVADFRPGAAADRKIKKQSEDAGLSVDMVANPDILATVARTHPGLYTVGFAAETHDLAAHARGKLERKGLDLVVANDVSDATIGFGSDENVVTLVDRAGDETLPRMRKDALSARLIERIAARLPARRGGDEERAGTAT